METQARAGEDGADDHPITSMGSKLASLWEERAGTVSPRCSRIRIVSTLQIAYIPFGEEIPTQR